MLFCFIFGAVLVKGFTVLFMQGESSDTLLFDSEIERTTRALWKAI